MWRFIGRSAGVVAVALALAACADEPTVTLKVSRAGSGEVTIKVCLPGAINCEGEGKPLFASGLSPSEVRSVGLYVGDDTAMLEVRFLVSSPPSQHCHVVQVPTTSRLTARVSLPLANGPPTVEDCVGCLPAVCTGAF